MRTLAATPYVPGRVRGTLRFGPAAAAPGVIVALRQREVAALGARPAGIILVDASPFSHPTLRLLSQAIPTVLAEQGQLEGLVEGNEVLLDGRGGQLTSPVPASLPVYAQPSPPELGKAVSTVDGVSVELRASVSSVAGSAAALAVDEFLDGVDFAALGCNDLMQCLFAADRDLPELRAWLDPHAPALYRFLDMVAHQASGSASALQVCGLLPQWPGILPVLLGLGYRAFSVDPVMIPWLAETVRQTDTKQAVQLARAVRESRRPAEVKQLLADAAGAVASPCTRGG